VGAIAQRAKPGHVVGVQMRVHGLDQFNVELTHQLQIAIDALEDRIDDQRLAAMPAGEQIGISAGRAVEELAKDHRRLLLLVGIIHPGYKQRDAWSENAQEAVAWAAASAAQPSGL
jgi:hypothetical protein